MRHAIRSLDRILKGEATRPEAVRGGVIEFPLAWLSLVLLGLGAFYGLCMGAYAVIHRWGTPKAHMGWEQAAASAAKVPLLFFLTLLVTLPSLYVFNALVGSRLTFRAVVRLLVAALAVMLALQASFGTIVLFFSVSTTSYAFMVLLNVVLFAVSGFLGLGFLLQTLQRLSPAPRAAEPQPTIGAAVGATLASPSCRGKGEASLAPTARLVPVGGRGASPLQREWGRGAPAAENCRVLRRFDCPPPFR